MLKSILRFLTEPEPEPASGTRQNDAEGLDRLDLRALADLPAYHPRPEPGRPLVLHDRMPPDC
ncbi:hypothetical protein [Pelagibacterium halotolerans]|uniref:Uncharacterized protein n=1 Tax=Pelagibacterium halotolerans (strain DSM 22347 / JCM 15775 / CGMCC 1.7692 / B2) TaxID=1082931 RepID=G4RA68_PELHB|nr:hypothetical protein [Pelagibacterium halotolerans]AEQ53551.1 hypothetical protein KKY_3566 [Pelagibacterium halotolerans B2]QJR20271.1 hypothetical protein HKM20_18625 [Pelagibacterium halotolerans]